VRSNRRFAEEVVAFPQIESSDRVLKVGFGPGGPIGLLASAATGVAGIDVSKERVEQASARIAAAIRPVRSSCDTARWHACPSRTTPSI
jgi:cyclopropane fatty-acyl-phospholipid synthase-like methyltransferase